MEAPTTRPITRMANPHPPHRARTFPPARGPPTHRTNTPINGRKGPPQHLRRLRREGGIRAACQPYSPKRQKPRSLRVLGRQPRARGSRASERRPSASVAHDARRARSRRAGAFAISPHRFVGAGRLLAGFRFPPHGVYGARRRRLSRPQAAPAPHHILQRSPTPRYLHDARPLLRATSVAAIIRRPSGGVALVIGGIVKQPPIPL